MNSVLLESISIRVKYLIICSLRDKKESQNPPCAKCAISINFLVPSYSSSYTIRRLPSFLNFTYSQEVFGHKSCRTLPLSNPRSSLL